MSELSANKMTNVGKTDNIKYPQQTGPTKLCTAHIMIHCISYDLVCDVLWCKVVKIFVISNRYKMEYGYFGKSSKPMLDGQYACSIRAYNKI